MCISDLTNHAFCESLKPTISEPRLDRRGGQPAWKYHKTIISVRKPQIIQRKVPGLCNPIVWQMIGATFPPQGNLVSDSKIEIEWWCCDPWI